MTAPRPEALLCDDCLLTGIEVDTADELMHALAKPLSSATGIAPELIAENLIKRERLGSTGFGGGAAIPHARFPGIEGCVTALATLSRPLAFDALDGEPIDVAFCLISPEEAGADHLRYLAAIGRFFRDADLMKRVRAAEDTTELACRHPRGRVERSCLICRNHRQRTGSPRASACFFRGRSRPSTMNGPAV